MGPHSSDQHHHGDVHLGQADWEALAAHAELEGEVLLEFVTRSAHRVAEHRDPDAPPVRRVLDIGSGPGVGTCELARCFPEARVVAVDGAPAMLALTSRRAVALGVERRVATHLADLTAGLDGLAPADVIWASMSLHHVGDEVALLRRLGELLEPAGLVVVAEVFEPMRVLPDDLDVGRPGLADRLALAQSEWFDAMRAGLPGYVHSTEPATMVTAAGLEVVASELSRLRFDPPLPDGARRLVVQQVDRARSHLAAHLDDEDRQTLEVLGDPADARGVGRRSDVFLDASRRIVIAGSRDR